MKTKRLTDGLQLFLALLLLALPGRGSAETEKEFEQIFDGETLDEWDGNPKFWSVEDNAITGETTEENPAPHNTFIIWRGGKTRNFELKLEYRIRNGNSGVQYRSFETSDDWVVGGYQADLEGGDTWSGANYGEKFRGILAKRGQKTIIGDNHKPKVVGSVGDSEKLQSHIDQDGWNQYHIIAKGYRFTHKINGHVMSKVIDKDEAKRRDSGLLALQLHAGPPMKVQFRNIRIKRLPDDLSASEKKKVVFVAGRGSHGYGAHEHKAGSMLLADKLEENVSNIETQVYTGGWPDDPNAFEGADSIVMFCDGGGGHMVNDHLDQVDALAEQGVGIACLHYGVEVPKGKPGNRFLDWIGGYFETHWSVNPHWTGEFDEFPEHAITRGVEPFEIYDEWYYHMRFREDMEGVTPILSDLPPESSLDRPDGAHSNNPHVRKAVLKKEKPQHVAWAYERPDGGRGFGFTGGHFHWNWGHDQFRKLVLNAIAWTSKVKVPSEGIASETPTVKELQANQDYEAPDDFDPKKIRRKLKRWNGQDGDVTHEEDSEEEQAKSEDSEEQPKFASDVVTTDTPGNAVDVKVDIEGAEQLHLVVTDGGDGIACDWADWAKPRLVGPDGEKRLTELEWEDAESGWGQVNVDENADGGPLRIAGESVPYGIGTHAYSVISYSLPEGHEFTHFKARAGLDNGGTDQANGNATSVAFRVFTAKPPKSLITAAQRGANPSSNAEHDPDDAVEQLQVHEDLQAELMAAEPKLHSPSNIDIDHKGRVWVCEIINYRGHRKERPEGDRILVFEDVDKDGRLEEKTVFYQGTDINSPHGICVLPDPNSDKIEVIVSTATSQPGPHVTKFIDRDGDLKPDDRKLLFTGISGAQHDHSIHAFVFGPDGKFYFNMGNAGHQIKDADGNIIVDKEGNEVRDNGKPYREGMVFRCNPDLSEFETLGWNFRNNWMVTVDSFGTMWQSDNDDDGNRGVRINYVMQYGNYGYRDEMTGAGWRKERANMAEDIPTRHWHQHDPGVVPNLLQTGAGSPTGITIYEGDLLPKVFQNEMLHTDAGPNVARAYPVKKDGAGYEVPKIVNILHSEVDPWFRPSDVAVAPDGSLIVADWYDPGVGGHNAGSLDTGRLFRVAPKGNKSYHVPEFDFSTAESAAEALRNPNYTVRYMAWTALHNMGKEAAPALKQVWQSDDPRYRARALWLLGKIPGRGKTWVKKATNDGNSDIRITGIRLAKQLDINVIPVVRKLVHDSSPQVRRECAIALHHNESSKAPELWAELAVQHDGKDRWYLEALGIGARDQWNEFFGAWLNKVGDDWKSKAGRDIVWRSRADKTPRYLAKLIKDSETTKAEEERYFRAMDFQTGPEKQKALQTLIGELSQ